MKSNNKIVNLVKLIRIVKHLRRQDKKIIFTNGCFDILHPGHISYLEEAKEKNGILVVGLNSDSSVRKIKGKSRPIISQLDRAKVLASVSCVDYIVIFNTATPLKLIRLIKPDVLVKGADWKGRVVVGESFVNSYGGRVRLVKYLKGYSTTKIINHILSLCKR
ncbi:MAG: D-glycero-beta-D-manno-heptose 1-phosphate adenylyltransferase [Candidatus Omnitrophota bacterium]|nr:D-glycero-beta-D-manno-heptose 1-phosphate adenylyltransferase [Candidatus Omnitrophota bacterium]